MTVTFIQSPLGLTWYVGRTLDHTLQVAFVFNNSCTVCLIVHNSCPISIDDNTLNNQIYWVIVNGYKAAIIVNINIPACSVNFSRYILKSFIFLVLRTYLYHVWASIPSVPCLLQGTWQWGMLHPCCLLTVGLVKRPHTCAPPHYCQ